MKTPDGTQKQPGLTSSQWAPHFRKAGVLAEEINGAKSERAKATLLGHFLSMNVDREVAIQVGDRPGHARLRVAEGKPRRYFLEITWDGPSPEGPATTVAGLDDGLSQANPGDAGATPGPGGPIDEAPGHEPAVAGSMPEPLPSANQEDWG